jgi:predicted transcriptional regulator
MSDSDLARIEELLEVLVRLQLGPTIANETSDSSMRKLYELTGKKPVLELSRELGMSSGKISRVWQKWESMGIIRKQGKSYKKLFD